MTYMSLCGASSVFHILIIYRDCTSISILDTNINLPLLYHLYPYCKDSIYIYIVNRMGIQILVHLVVLRGNISPHHMGIM